MAETSLLDLAAALDRDHETTRTREALGRWWALVTAGAHALDDRLPPTMLRSAVVLRGARLSDDEPDNAEVGRGHVLIAAGSPLGHRAGTVAWAVQTTGPRGGGAMEGLNRVPKLAEAVSKWLGVSTFGVLLHLGEEVPPERFAGSTLVVSLGQLRTATPAWNPTSPWALPGAMWDATLVRLGLLWNLAQGPIGSTFDPLALARTTESRGWPVRPPVKPKPVLPDKREPLAAFIARRAPSASMLRDSTAAALGSLQNAGYLEGMSLGGEVPSWLKELADTGLAKPHSMPPRLTRTGDELAASVSTVFGRRSSR